MTQHALDFRDEQPPTLEYAARVVYEGMAHCQIPDALLEAITTCERRVGPHCGPVWSDLPDDARRYLIQLVHDACVPFDRIDEALEPQATITVSGAA